MNNIQGVGINDLKGKINVSDFKSYDIWKGILRRCYSKEQNKDKSYKNIKVCEEWLLYSNFKKWYDKNFPSELEKNWKLQIDKDLLSRKNKIYSPQTCIFLPKKINTFLSNQQNSNTSGVVGVSYIKSSNSWRARIRNFDNHDRIYLGCYSDKNTAGEVYIKARMKQAEKAKDILRKLNYPENIIELIK